MMLSAILTVMLALSVPAAMSDSSKVRVSGGLESDNAVYVADEKTGSLSEPRFGSNNWLKLDLASDHFDAGLQVEAYPEPLRGFDSGLKGAGVPFYYIRYRGGGLEVTAGSFYEQFGSGLLFRSWEDRELGHNNAVTGLHLAYSTRDDILTLKALCGLPRYCLNSVGAGEALLAKAFSPWFGTVVGGADASLDLGRLLGSDGATVLLEGSILDRNERDVPAMFSFLASSGGFEIPRNVVSWSARTSLAFGAFSLKLEHVSKGADFHVDKIYRSADGYSLKRGNAQLLEADYVGGNFTASLSARRLSNIQQDLFRSPVSGILSNTICYVPALCMRQTYMLASLNPYVPNVDGEAGGQADFFYNWRRGTSIGGRYGMKLHLNGSYFWTLPQALSNWEVARLAYRDINVELEKRWSGNFQTTLFVSIQENSPSHGDRFKTEAQNVFVLEGLYRFSKGVSLRSELQYLYSQELSRDWMAALAELSFAPHWSFHLSDMYNHGLTRVHYYDVGASYSSGAVRMALNYGRHRAGMVCSGGVCRYQPAFTGGMLQLSYSF